MNQTRKHLRTIYQAAINAVAGKTVVAEELLSGTYPDDIHVVAIGKAADAMVQGVPSEKVKSGLLISKHGHISTDLKQNPRFISVESDHPIPKQASLQAGKSLIEYLVQLPEKEPCLFLISGGTSALAEVLPEGWDLSSLQALNDYLLGNAYSIDEINAVRRRVSKIKGGGLWKYIGERPVFCLMISDVQDDQPAVIGSGLLFPSASELPLNLPKEWSDLIKYKKGELTEPDSFKWKIIASLQDAKNTAEEQAKALGYRVINRPEFLSGNAEEVAKDCVNTLRSNPDTLFVWGGETTVKLPKNAGLGGRNQHLALAAAIEMAGSEKSVLLAAGTDGSDGNSDATGAIVDGQTMQRGTKLKLDANDYFARADSNSFFQKTDEQILTGATGTNVMDLVIGIQKSPLYLLF